MLRAALTVTLFALAGSSLRAADDEKVYSGPDVGKKLTPFKVLAVHGPQAGKEFEVIAECKGGPTVVIFVHEWTRQTLQLARGLDAYGVKWGDRVKTHFVTLSEDKVKAEEYLKRAQGSLNLKSPSSVSLDGLEGPGNYGLNRKMTCTVLVANKDVVFANFAIIQPNETDVPKVVAKIAEMIGEKVPTAEEVRKETGNTGRVPPAANARDPELTQLMRSMINLSNDEAKVKEIAEAMLKWAGDNREKKAQLTAFAKEIVKLGYGTDPAKAALKRIAGE